MLPSLGRCFLLLTVFGHSFAFPSPPSSRKEAGVSTHIAIRQAGDDTDFDEGDLSFITKLAALGDSYSAGIGAGDRLGSITGALDPQSGT